MKSQCHFIRCRAFVVHTPVLVFSWLRKNTLAPRWLEWSSCGCVYADDHVSGTCFGTKLHLYFCLLRQPLITSTKSTFVALVWQKHKHRFQNDKKKKNLSCMFHLPLSPRTDLNVYQNLQCD